MGVDPSLRSTGYAVISIEDKIKLLDLGVIRTSSKDRIECRIQEIFKGVLELIDLFSPYLLSLETAFLGKNFQSSMKIGYAKSVIMLAAVQNNLILKEIAPRQVKKAICGKGSATKEQVSFMLEKLIDYSFTKKIPNDASDALAIALAGYRFWQVENRINSR